MPKVTINEQGNYYLDGSIYTVSNTKNKDKAIVLISKDRDIVLVCDTELNVISEIEYTLVDYYDAYLTIENYE